MRHLYDTFSVGTIQVSETLENYTECVYISFKDGKSNKITSSELIFKSFPKFKSCLLGQYLFRSMWTCVT